MSPSSRTNNRKNNFLVLGEIPTDDINSRFGTPEQKFITNFSKAKTKFYLSLQYNGDNSYVPVNRKKVYKFKADNFPTQSRLGSLFNKCRIRKSII